MRYEIEKTIIISDEYIYTPRIESAAQMSISPFAGIYHDAMKSLEYICKQTVNGKSGNEPVKEYNPIIAFVGERGSGKTSALESFKRALEEGYRHNGETVWSDDEVLKNSKFDVLPTIDPTALSEHESLLSVIAAHMYREIERFQDECRGICKGDNPDTTVRNAALQLQELYDALRALNQERAKQFAEFAGYERLGQLSISYNLREQFKKAVDAYLKLTVQIHDGPDSAGKSRFLVIPIDDLDMNAKDGYKLCEELRRYMMVPGIVVLMSAKIDQLQNVIAQELVEQLPNEKGTSGSMAERYLAKLIPINRRHALPILTIYNMIDYEIAPKEGDKFPLVDTFFNLLYNRLGLILIKNDFGSHVILPRTLRGIVHLFYLLHEMPPVFGQCITTPLEYDDNRIQNIDKLSHNIDAFWDHFLSNGIEETADSLILSKLLRQMRTEHWSGVNRLVVKAIKKVMDSEKMIPEESDHEASIADICSVEAIKENVSLGDALYMLDKLETWTASPQWERLVASVRVAYSLLLIQMFFIERRPDHMRRFIVQLNNPDMQEMVPPSIPKLVRPIRLDNERTQDRRRDWQTRFDWMSKGLPEENVISLARYYADIKKKTKVDESIIYSDSPLKWGILNIVWCGYQRSMNKSLINWRSFWDEPYLDSTELLDNPNTQNITINYIAFVTNLLSPSALWNREETADEKRKKYVMVFPLYSVDLIQYIISHAKKASIREQKNRPNQNEKQERIDFEYFDFFIEGMKASIDTINGKKGNPPKHPQTIAMQPLDSQVMASYKEVQQIQRLSQNESVDPSDVVNLTKMIRELTSLNKKGSPIRISAGRIVRYCDEVISMFDRIKILGPSQREIMAIKKSNENLSVRANSAADTQDDLINALKRIVDRNTQVSDNG